MTTGTDMYPVGQVKLRRPHRACRRTAGGAGRRPPAWFASRDEAGARYLRVSGLAGLLPPGHPAVDAGLCEQGGKWRLAMDPGTVGPPDMVHRPGCFGPERLGDSASPDR